MSADHVGRKRDVLTRAHELAQSLATWAMIRSTSSNVSMFATKKNAADFVTDIDLGIELWVRRTIAEEFPTHAFVGEEFEDSAGVEYTWYCDPIDGTTNYAHGISWFSFSLAMCDEDGPVVGVVADPRTKEIFSAIRGRGAMHRGGPISVEHRSTLPGSVVLTELLGATFFEGQAEFIRSLGEIDVTSRIMGSGTLSLVGPAVGRGHGALVGRFGAVDHLASMLIAHEAGLRVLDWDGQDTMFPSDPSTGIMVAHPAIATELHGMWRRAVESEGDRAR